MQKPGMAVQEAFRICCKPDQQSLNASWDCHSWFFAWLMLLRFSFDVSGRTFSNCMFSFLLIIFHNLGVGYFIARTTALKPAILIKSTLSYALFLFFAFFLVL